MTDGMVGNHNLDAPDLVEPIIAFRSWALQDERLVGPYRGSAWTRQTDAQCELPHHPAGKPPGHGDCACGLYGYFALPDGTWPNNAFHGAIRGAIAASGCIAIHETGLRAEHAKIVCLVEEERALNAVGSRAAFRKLASRYNVPVIEPEHLQTLAYEYGTPVPESIMARVRALNEAHAAKRAQYERHRQLRDTEKQRKARIRARWGPLAPFFGG